MLKNCGMRIESSRSTNAGIDYVWLREIFKLKKRDHFKAIPFSECVKVSREIIFKAIPFSECVNVFGFNWVR